MTPNNDELTVYLTGRPFPPVSVTGPKCEQMCEHCKGAHLKWMIDIRGTPDLFRVINDLLAAGAEGLLVSGGCDVNGSVPIMKEVPAIKYAHDNGMKVNVHTGFIGKDDAKRLVDAGVTAFSVDVHQDPDIIRNILHLEVPAEAYSELLDNIISAGGEAVAHLTVGFGTEDLMRSAELIKRKGLKEVVLLALVPTKGTMTEKMLITDDEIIDAAGALMDMGFNVILGCMRPRANRDLEVRCIELGIRRIANPSRKTILWARENGMKVIVRETCCCIRDH
ncbi:MAG: hypothetical protein LBE47_03690 [Methanomassiliicoccaceae archaeon]|nr:hypothetical protein [Methanomassiliicoccaceae archaeon]